MRKYDPICTKHTSLRFQLPASSTFPSLAHTLKTRLDVNTPSAHRRCIAIPGGDHAIDTGALTDTSSPIEYVDLGAACFSGTSSGVNHETGRGMWCHEENSCSVSLDLV